MLPQTSVTFVSKTGMEKGDVKSYNLRKQVEVVKNCRTVTKQDMKYNNIIPRIEVDPNSGVSESVQSRSRPTYL